MPKTREDLINKALDVLKVLAVGQSVSGTDVDKMDAIVDTVVAELAGLDIYYVSDAGELGPEGGAIEDSAFLAVADYLANASGTSFGFYNDDRLQALAMLAEGKLRTLAAPPRTLKALRIDPALRARRLGTYTGGFN